MARQSTATAWKPARPNPGFEHWLAMMDHVVEDDFLTFDLDGMPDDPYTEEGLRIAEAAALHQFPDRASVTDPHNAELADKYIRFVGQAFVRGLGLTWTDEPPFEGDPPTMSIVVPPIADGLGPIPVSVPSLLLAAIKRRTGEEWAFMFDKNEQRLGNRQELGTDDL